MTGRRLRNIFAAKYLPILQRISGLEITEDFTETKPSEDSYTQKDYTFKIVLPSGRNYLVVFRDLVWSDGTVQSWHLTFNWWLVPQHPSQEDWRRFYGILNKLVSRILAIMVAHSIHDAIHSNENVILPNGVSVEFKFTLSKIHLRYMSEENRLIDVPLDIPKEGDIIEALTETMGLFLL